MDQDPATRIEKEIRSRFSQGIDPAPETTHFIESTYGVISAEAIGELLCSEEGGDEVLVDLLFSPDEPLCCRIESHLPPGGLLPEGRDRLASRLRQKPLDTRLLTKSGSAPASLPGEMVDGFLDRFCLDRPLDEKLAAAVAGRCTADAALRVRWRIRQAGLAGTREATDALGRLLAAQSPDTKDFWPLFEALAGFLKSFDEGTGLFASLVDRKQTCLRHLRQAADRSRAFARHNVETILLGGSRLPHIDTDALAMEIVHIDDLCRIVFGRTAPVPDAGLSLAAEEISGPEDLRRLVRFFLKSERA